MLNHLHTKKRFTRQRESSWDHTGANRDSEHIPAGETHYRSVAYWYGRPIS